MISKHNMDGWTVEIGVDIGRIGDEVRKLPSTTPLHEVKEIAYQLHANIILKAPRGQWYIKKYPKDEINTQIQKAHYRIKPTLTKYTYEYSD